jgi:hypothetical protein
MDNYKDAKIDAFSPKITKKAHKYNDASMPIKRRRKQNDMSMYYFKPLVSVAKNFHSDVYFSSAQRDTDKIDDSTYGNFKF